MKHQTCISWGVSVFLFLGTLFSGSALYAAPKSNVFTISDRARAKLPQRVKRRELKRHSLRAMALRRGFVAKHTDKYSYEIPRNKTKAAKIRDQKKSGRCWIYAAENVLRSKLALRGKDPGDLSTAFLNYHALQRRAHKLIEMAVIPAADGKPLPTAIGEGGFNHYATELIRDHGIVPKNKMDSSADSHNSGVALRQLQTVIAAMQRDVRKTVRELKGKKDPKAAAKVMAKLVEDYQAKATKVLDSTVGRPPRSFVVKGKRYTPKTYAEKYLGLKEADLDYVTLSHIPNAPAGHLAKVGGGIGLPGGEVLNVSQEVFRKAAFKTLRKGESVWFASNVSPDNPFRAGLEKSDPAEAKGILSLRAFNYEAFGGVSETAKSVRLRRGVSPSNHAMAISGYDKKGGKIVKWKVDNSWGEAAGDQGNLHMYDDFFRQYVTMVTVPRSVLPKKVLAKVEQGRKRNAEAQKKAMAKFMKMFMPKPKKVEVEDPKGWGSKRKQALVLQIIGEKLTIKEAARKHKLHINTVRAWHKKALAAIAEGLTNTKPRRKNNKPKPAKTDMALATAALAMSGL